MIRFFPYILKNLRGHRARTWMTVGAAALLMFLFVFVSSIQEGLAHLTDPTRQDDRLIVYQKYSFCPSSSQLPHDPINPIYETEIRKVDGVKEILPMKVLLNNCRASLDTVIFHGVPPEVLPRVRKLTFLSGGWDRFVRLQSSSAGAQNDLALVGRRIAERRGLRVGQSFTAAGVSVQVEGIFASDNSGEENVIYVPLTFLQYAGHHPDPRVTQFEVHTQDASQSNRIAAEIDNVIEEKYGKIAPTVTRPQNAHFQQALADLVEVVGFTRWLGIVCVGVVVVLIANSVIMAAQDRVKEHAVLQTIGYSGSRIFGLMLAESLIISLLGGILGISASLSWVYWKPLAISTEGVSIDFLATPALALWGLGLSTLVGVLAGLVPAWQAGRADIVASLR